MCRDVFLLYILYNYIKFEEIIKYLQNNLVYKINLFNFALCTGHKWPRTCFLQEYGRGRRVVKQT